MADTSTTETSERKAFEAYWSEDCASWGARDVAWFAWKARAALASQPVTQSVEPVAWKPIETAPKDGRSLLLGYFNSAGKWRTLRGQWMSEAYIAEYWDEPDDVEPGWFEDSVEADDMPNCWSTKPTHWMPLPAAPQSVSQEAGEP